MTHKARVGRRVTAFGSAAVLAIGLLSATAGGALATTNVDCPGMHVILKRVVTPDEYGNVGFGVDDDVLITLNSFVLLNDHDGLAQEFAPMEFPVQTGDQLHIVATNSPIFGGNAFISSLALFCTSNTNVQILLPAGFNPPNIGAGQEFFNETYIVTFQEPLAEYSFTGFSQPVDNLPTVNQMKAGAAVPVKFSLDGDQGLGIFADGYPKSQTITCSSTSTVDGIEETVSAGGSSLTYDPVSGTYTYVWKTEKSWAGTCRQLVVKLTDGTYHRANFQFK
jgi:hypothetical protein